MLGLIFYIVAGVLFALATLDVEVPKVNTLALGLLFFTLGHLA